MVACLRRVMTHTNHPTGTRGPSAPAPIHTCACGSGPVTTTRRIWPPPGTRTHFVPNSVGAGTVIARLFVAAMGSKPLGVVMVTFIPSVLARELNSHTHSPNGTPGLMGMSTLPPEYTR